MRACKCDRCKKYIDADNIPFIRVFDSHGDVKAEADICTDCFVKLIGWLDEDEENEK